MNSSFYQKYPFYGTISRCTDNGYGFLDGPNGEEFIHLRDHSGRKLQSMLDLEGKPCVFVVGGHPFQHKKQKLKDKWWNAFIEWRLLDDISPESIGELIAVWENKTIFNSMFWDINPFDQWGVELGKINTKAELEK